MSSSRSIYFVAGEVSGDAHGAALLRAMRARQAGVSFHGRGGSQMRAVAGETIEDWCDAAAVVGLWEVIKRYGYFRAQFARVLGEIERLQPAAVVLIDYPGFNLRLAAEIRRRGLPLKIIYYISPQVWAWNRARIPRMARLLDLMLCIFPFEPALYKEAGLKSIFVGHPLLDVLESERRGPPVARETNLVGLFPGSRQREVRKIFPIMLRAAGEMRAKQVSLRFAAAAPSEKIAGELRVMRDEAGWSATDCNIGVANARRLMQTAAVGMVASGTATVEAASLGMPLVIVYKVSTLTYWVGRAVIRVPFLGMINLLAGREIAREFIQDQARPTDVAAGTLRLLDDPAIRQQHLADLASIVARLGGGGADRRAAEAILAEMKWQISTWGTTNDHGSSGRSVPANVPAPPDREPCG